MQELAARLVHVQAAEENDVKFRPDVSGRKADAKSNFELSRNERNLMVPFNMSGQAVFKL